jgi:hypothetical protein
MLSSAIRISVLVIPELVILYAAFKALINSRRQPGIRAWSSPAMILFIVFMAINMSCCVFLILFFLLTAVDMELLIPLTFFDHFKKIIFLVCISLVISFCGMSSFLAWFSLENRKS